MKNTSSIEAKILVEKLEIQAHFKVRFLRRNDKLPRIKNFKAYFFLHCVWMQWNSPDDHCSQKISYCPVPVPNCAATSRVFLTAAAAPGSGIETL